MILVFYLSLYRSKYILTSQSLRENNYNVLRFKKVKIKRGKPYGFTRV